MRKGRVSNNVIRRLPKYLRKLDQLSEQGVARISSFELGEQLGLTPSQIRQDFSNFGEFGQQGYGYSVASLRDQIASILGMNKGHNAIMVGVGRIGHALLDNFGFESYGVNIKCAFDIKPSLIGTEVNGVPVIDMDSLADYHKENTVDFAILTVAKDAALSVGNILIENGVKAIWNLTNVELTEPDSPVIVENLHFSDSLLALSYYIDEAEDEK